MGVIQDRIRVDLKNDLKTGNRIGIDSRRVLIGEFQRQSKKDLTMEEEVKVLKTLEKSEEELIRLTQGDEESEYLKIVRQYLPTLADVEEIKGWILNNVNFSILKTPMQAVGITMKVFGPRADGNTVKKIVTELLNKE